MITDATESATIREIKEGYTSDRKLRLYIIEGEGCFLYVGKSKCAISRVLSHLGIGSWSGFFGSLFDFMLTSNPKANDYTVYFLDENKIKKTINHFGDINSKVDDLESLLIYELSPVYNTMGKKKSREPSSRWNKLYPPIAINV